MERVAAFDVARGLAVALVVLLHATLMPYAAAGLPQPICRMALLMLVSGVLAAPTSARDASYYRRRAFDLLWLMLVWTPITLLAAGGLHGLAATPAELVSPTGHLWYIGGLALLLATVPLVGRAPALLPLAITAAGAAWHTLGGRTGAPGWDHLLQFSPFFYLGLFGRDRLLAVLDRCGAKVGAGAALGLVLLLLLPLPHHLVTLGSAVALMLVAQGLAGTPLRVALSWFGRQTPAIYLAHMPILWLLVGRAPPLPLPAIMVLVAATVGACLTLQVFTQRLGLAFLYQRPRLPTFAVRHSHKALA
jgi:hypothetical protein